MPTKTHDRANAASSKVTPKSPAKKSMEKSIASAKNGVAPKKLTSSVPIAENAQQRADLDIDHFRSLLQGERNRLEAEVEGIRSRSMDVEGSLPDEGESGDEDTA